MSSTMLARREPMPTGQWEELPRGVFRGRNADRPRLQFGARRTVTAPSGADAQQPDDWDLAVAREISDTWHD